MEIIKIDKTIFLLNSSKLYLLNYSVKAD